MQAGRALHAQQRFIALCMVLLAAAGILAGIAMPVALFPRVHFPRIIVSIDAGDQPAERMAVAVTAPLEDALRAMPGVASVRSVTSRGESEISVLFDWSQDMDTAYLRTLAEVNQLLPGLPAGSHSSVSRMDPTVFPCLALSLTSRDLSLGQLRDLAWKELRPAFATVPGVARVEVQGGETTELHAIVDPARLRTFGLSIAAVVEAIGSGSVESASGRIQDQGRLYLVIGDEQTRTAAEVANLPLHASPHGIVRVGDVATVFAGASPQWIRNTADGRDGVSLLVFQQPDGNTVHISAAIQARLAALQTSLPPSCVVATWYDQSDLITSSMASVRDALLVGVLLAGAVLLICLRSWSITLIAVGCVPLVLTITLLALRLCHLELNIMTLGGMAAAIGLIIDDAIVMVEHLEASFSTGPPPTAQDVYREAWSFAGPMAASSLATIVIFLPLIFLSGVTGAFFTALSITMAASLCVSFLVSLLLLPLVCGPVLRARSHRPQAPRPRTAWIEARYARWMGWLLTHPWLVLLLILPIVGGGILAYRQVGSGFMPEMDEGGFIIDYQAAPGSSLAETDRLARQVEGILRATPEVATYSRRTGAQLGDGLTESNEGDFFVRLRPRPRAACAEVMDQVRHRIEAQVAGLQVDMSQLMEDLIGDLVGNPHPIEVILSGDSLPVLSRTAAAVAAALPQVPGVVDINNGVVVAGDTLAIDINRDQAALEGISPQAILDQVQGLVSGTIAGSVLHDQALVDIRVWIATPLRDSARHLAELPLHAADGHALTLERVASIRRLPGQLQINHIDLTRVIAVTTRIEGRDLGSTISAVQRLLRQPGLVPGSVHVALGGIYEQQQAAFHDLLVVLGSAVALVFLLLVFLYHSVRIAIAMLLTTSCSLAGVFIGLALTGVELNLTSMMGLTMVVGIVTEVSILYGSALHVSQRQIPLDQRLISAGLVRLRPIVMTVGAAALALLPLALGLGAGADMQRPLAIAIISGLVLQLPLTVVVLPMLLRWMRIP